jgi:hypothetical protein
LTAGWFASAWLATEVDVRMLGRGLIADPDVDLQFAAPRPGVDVAQELRGRMLLRYAEDPHEAPRPQATFVSPTAYSADEASDYLAFPAPKKRREYVLFLDPSRIPFIKGPKWCSLGQGVEYLLPDGYEEAAVLSPGWGVRIR